MTLTELREVFSGCSRLWALAGLLALSGVGSGCSSSSDDDDDATWGQLGDDDAVGDDDSSGGDDDSSGGDDDSAVADDDDSAVADDDDSALGDDDSSGENPMPDFSLVDVNPNSLLYNVPVSPRDYLQKVSGWYFGHAT